MAMAADSATTAGWKSSGSSERPAISASLLADVPTLPSASRSAKITASPYPSGELSVERADGAMDRKALEERIAGLRSRGEVKAFVRQVSDDPELEKALLALAGARGLVVEQPVDARAIVRQL